MSETSSPATQAGAPDYLAARRGVASWLLTLDHKRVALMYLASVLVAFALGVTLAQLVRLKLLVPGPALMDPDTFARLFTVHGVVMVFVFVLPAIPAALGNFLVPLMVGARGLAFPRLNLAALYLYWTGALLLVTSMARGGADAGWTLSPPYALVSETPVLYTAVGAAVLALSSALTGVNFLVTLHRRRAPGVGWYRLPLLLWALYGTSLVQVVATPAVAVALVLLAADRSRGLGMFDPRAGGDPKVFQQLFWFWAHPAVYLMVLPAMGVVSELIAVHAQRRISGYKLVAFSSLAIALFGLAAGGQHVAVDVQGPRAAAVSSLISLLAAAPFGVLIVHWLSTLRRGAIRLNAPMLYAVGFVAIFAVGGLSGLFLSMLSLAGHLSGTVFSTAHLHYLVVGGTLMAFTGGLLHWWPKISGRLYPERLAQAAWAVTFLGFNAAFFAQFVAGSRGLTRRTFAYDEGFQFLQAFSTVGAWLLAIGLLMTLAVFVQSLRTGAAAPANPWGGASLEWQTSSPPPADNFAPGPVVARGPYDFAPAPAPAASPDATPAAAAV